ncbi:hypothetical protein PTSG_11919 [Salpingoeca rosetta]|uniref:Uncharacterized protein n=1 Tax=Salpingoeca rosetta (strain ATCC 50818 / BSB-021) TaxID=946362 RepID=F2U3B2_SALR5|nr:uncharacterized protein PTSG_11919 [Salpingoeca rosetta]EGD82106.1 hypothetical protein PTSG_11919 [Salpingoeca rosetta]|eukprot:XP_004996289.1 hypothetical protein PTSG_11919 [Salpingoeca rosetta]
MIAERELSLSLTVLLTRYERVAETHTHTHTHTHAHTHTIASARLRFLSLPSVFPLSFPHSSGNEETLPPEPAAQPLSYLCCTMLYDSFLLSFSSIYSHCPCHTPLLADFCFFHLSSFQDCFGARGLRFKQAIPSLAPLLFVLPTECFARELPCTGSPAALQQDHIASSCHCLLVLCAGSAMAWSTTEFC